MTVLAYKDGIFATDTGCWQQDLVVGYARKIMVNDKFCWAACGAVPEVAAFGAWAETNFLAENRPPKSDNFGAIIIYKDTSIGAFKCGETFVIYNVSKYNSPIVDGAAVDFMLGIMHHGGSAIDAIKAAIERTAWAAGECDAFDTRTWEFITS